MTPEEAHQLLAAEAASFAATFIDYIYDNDPIEDAFENADPQRQELLRGAAELLVTTGESHYSGYVTDAGRVLHFPMEPQRLTRLVTHYRDGVQHSAEELSHILLGQAERLSDTDLDVLQELFVAAPASALVIGKAVLLRRRDGPAWDALWTHVAESENPAWLAAVCEFLTRRPAWEEHLTRWYAHLRTKPLPVRRATAAKVTARPWNLLVELDLEPGS